MRWGYPTTAASYDGMPNALAHSWTTFGDGTRLRVHSPVAATSTTVVSVTVVRGSTNASTPLLVRTHSSRWRRSSEAATRVWPGRDEDALRRRRANKPTSPPAASPAGRHGSGMRPRTRAGPRGVGRLGARTRE